MSKADNLQPSCAVVTKSGYLKFLEPSGHLGHVMGLIYLLQLVTNIIFCSLKLRRSISQTGLEGAIGILLESFYEIRKSVIVQFKSLPVHPVHRTINEAVSNTLLLVTHSMVQIPS